MKEQITDSNQKKLQSALLKKAFGYDEQEIIEEFVSGEDGEVKLSKKKITTKTIPPDMNAIKILLDQSGVPVENMTDEELKSEKLRLLKLLEKENIKGELPCKTQTKSQLKTLRKKKKTNS